MDSVPSIPLSSGKSELGAWFLDNFTLKTRDRDVPRCTECFNDQETKVNNSAIAVTSAIDK